MLLLEKKRERSDDNYNIKATTTLRKTFRKMLKISGIEISRNEQCVLLIHSYFINEVSYSSDFLLSPDWNSQFKIWEFEYSLSIGVAEYIFTIIIEEKSDYFNITLHEFKYTSMIFFNLFKGINFNNFNEKEFFNKIGGILKKFINLVEDYIKK